MPHYKYLTSDLRYISLHLSRYSVRMMIGYSLRERRNFRPYNLLLFKAHYVISHNFLLSLILNLTLTTQTLLLWQTHWNRRCLLHLRHLLDIYYSRSLHLLLILFDFFTAKLIKIDIIWRYGRVRLWVNLKHLRSGLLALYVVYDIIPRESYLFLLSIKRRARFSV